MDEAGIPEFLRNGGDPTSLRVAQDAAAHALAAAGLPPTRTDAFSRSGRISFVNAFSQSQRG